MKSDDISQLEPFFGSLGKIPSIKKSYLRGLWFRVIWAGFLLIFTGGVVFGFAALKPVLLESNVYQNLCSHTEFNGTVCAKQELAINRIFQITSSGINLLALPVGIVAAKIGKRASIATATFLFLVGFSTFSITYSPSSIPLIYQLLVLPFCFLLSAVAGSFMFIQVLLYSYDVRAVAPKYSSWISAFLTSCWDLSASVFYLFYLGFFYLHLSCFEMFLGYSAIFSIPLFLFIWKVNPPAISFEHVQDSDDDTDKLQQEPDHVETSVWSDIKSPRIFICWISVSLMILYMNFYISTLFEQLMGLNITIHQVRMMNNIFSILLPALGFSINLGFGKFLEQSDHKKKSWKGWLVCAFGGVIWGVLSTIPVAIIQYLTFVVFIGWRICVLTTLFIYIQENYSPEKFPVLAWGGLSTAGAS